MWPCTVVPGVDIFDSFLVVRLGKDMRCLACTTHSRDEVGGKDRASWRNSTRSAEVNCWRLTRARSSLDDCSAGLFMSMACVPALGHVKSFRTLSLSLRETHFLLLHVTRQSSSYGFPEDESVGPELAWQV